LAAALEPACLTRDTAELRPLIASKLSTETLLTRWSNLPAVDPVAFRNDIDVVIDSTLR
jgi:hypothetical protein